jgi:hypothetical protein
MSKEKIKAVEETLSQVSNGRRSFLKGILIGSAAVAAVAALPVMKSEALAQDDNDNAPKKKKKKKAPDNQ